MALNIPKNITIGAQSNLRRQQKVINRVVDRIGKVAEQAIDSIMDTAEFSKSFFEPSLNGIAEAIETYYVEVIHEAFAECKSQEKRKASKFPKEAREETKRLAKGTDGIPQDLRSLEKIFRDPKKVKALRRRAGRKFDEIRSDYLRKLKTKFNTLLPKILDNEITPAEAKKQMKEVWGASKSRVETIFRTETTNYFGKIQTSYFKKEEGSDEYDSEILGFMFDANLDGSTTEICRSRHGMIYRPDHTGEDSIEHNTPACHFNCRSHMIPLANTPENRKLLEDSRRDPAKNRSKIKPLPKGWR